VVTEISFWISNHQKNPVFETRTQHCSLWSKFIILLSLIMFPYVTYQFCGQSLHLCKQIWASIYLYNSFIIIIDKMCVLSVRFMFWTDIFGESVHFGSIFYYLPPLLRNSDSSCNCKTAKVDRLVCVLRRNLNILS
jgi:hypothetical protein